MLAPSSCALNEHGVVRVERFENESAVLLRLTALGAHLVTDFDDVGLTLGYAQRTYVFARGDADPEVSLAMLLDPDRWADGGKLAPGSDGSASGPPVLRASSVRGMTLDLNTARVGFGIGAAERAALVIPDDGTVVVVRYRSSGEGLPIVIIHPEKETP